MGEQQSEPVKWAKLTDKEKIGLVIKHVLKWHIATNQDVRSVYPCAYECSCGDKWGHWLNEEMAAQYHPHFDPLHSLDDAWLVIECLMGRYVFHFEVGDWSNESLYVVLTFDRTPAQNEIRTSAKTLPESLCIAALKACGVEVDA